MRTGFIFFFTFLTMYLSGQTGRNMTRQEYIDTYKDLAMREMERTNIPASITLAQGLLESGNGNSTLARRGNNHFGIKCHTDWKGKTIYHDDDEQNECFRKYKSVEESYRDHSDFLTGRSRYAELFTLKPDDYKGWAKGLKKTGYATSATYAEALIKIIEENNLHQYDMQVSGIRGAKTREKPSYATTHYAGGRMIYFNNRVKYVLAREGDSFYNLSEELDLFQWQLPKYNDTPDNKVFAEGDKVYIQPKRNQADVKHKTHTVKEGETLQSISQLYAIKLDKLAKRNGLLIYDKPAAGQQLLLRGKLKGQKIQLTAPRIEIKEEAPKDEFIIEFDADK
jgi:LysM repeat protein